MYVNMREGMQTVSADIMSVCEWMYEHVPSNHPVFFIFAL